MPRNSKAASFLAEPPSDPADLAGFPSHPLAVGARLHRIHSPAHDAWFFNADESWRFNLCLLEGMGTCYLAERPVAGLLESFKGLRAVDEADVQAKAHFSVTLDRALRLADCCAAGAGLFGVNAEIHSTTDYAKTQRWAGAFARAGFDGVRYFCRSDPAMALIGVALFDDIHPAPGRWPEGNDRPIAEPILIEAERYGLRVLPTP